MATTHTLTGNVYDLGAVPFGAKQIRVYVVTNLPTKPPAALIDKTTNGIHLGGKPAVVDLATGGFTIELISTDATDLNVPANEVQYEVRAEYIDMATQARATWPSGWFPITADANLADIATEVSPMAVSSASGFAQEAAASADAAQAALEAAQDIVVTDLGTTDGQMTALITNPASDAAAALAAAIADLAEVGSPKIVYVSPTGNDANTGLTMSGAKATLTGAHAVMGTSPGTIVLDNGVISVGSGFQWPSNAKCGMVGQGLSLTTLKATAQSGPVLDLTGVGYNLVGCEFAHFAIEGDGASDATKANKGIRFDPNTSYTRGWVHDIGVSDTGGACFDLGYAEVSDFDRLIAFEPVNASANDVPYLMATGAFNGNRIRGLQLHGVSAGATVGASGAVIIKDNALTAPHSNKIDAPLVQSLHLTTDATIFAIAGNGIVLNDLQCFDTNKVSGATGTSYARYTNPTGTALNAGGNLMTGPIPGKGTNVTDIDMGVDMRQSRNAVVGVKGFRGTNVTLASGVGTTYVELGGALSTATDPAVVDNSGVTTNVIIDGYLATQKLPATTYTFGTASYKHDQVAGGAFAGMPRFCDPATPANGGVLMGTSGSRWSAAGTTMTGTADGFNFRDIALANILGVTKFGGVKGLKFYTTTSLPAASVSYRSTVAVVEGGAGVADRFVICRKDAADAYAWVDLF